MRTGDVLYESIVFIPRSYGGKTSRMGMATIGVQGGKKGRIAEETPSFDG